MLVLNRLVDQRIIINDDIIITIIGIKGNEITMGISAPKNVSIRCEKNYQKIKPNKENSNEIESVGNK